ncbi:hypothetical protein NWQ33_01100 [Mycoplasmopsis cynos]|nr:hypothetical protein [Mycoplasmopsis cynos]
MLIYSLSQSLKKSYGFITKDFILQKKPQETTNLYKELQNKIKEINK